MTLRLIKTLNKVAIEAIDIRAEEIDAKVAEWRSAGCEPSDVRIGPGMRLEGTPEELRSVGAFSGPYLGTLIYPTPDHRGVTCKILREDTRTSDNLGDIADNHSRTADASIDEIVRIVRELAIVAEPSGTRLDQVILALDCVKSHSIACGTYREKALRAKGATR